MTIHQIINDYDLSNGGAQQIAINLHKAALNNEISSRLFGLSNSPDYTLNDCYHLKYKSPYSLAVFFLSCGFILKKI